jgi:hypothetical protein
MDQQNQHKGGALASHFATYYPTGYVVAVIEPAAVPAAVDALRSGPCSPDEVRTFTGQEALDIAAAVQGQRTPLQRAAALLVSDEQEAEAEYLDAARVGQSLVVVHAPTPDQAQRVAAVLAAHGARRMHHYGRLVMTDLSSGPDRTRM